MDNFWKATAILLMAAILAVSVGRTERDISAVMTAAACCAAAGIAFSYLSPVLELLGKLSDMGNIRSDLVRILLKALGIGAVSELGAMLCRDMGNQSLEKTMHLLGSAAIVYLSLPLLEDLLTILENLLGDV